MPAASATEPSSADPVKAGFDAALTHLIEAARAPSPPPACTPELVKGARLRASANAITLEALTALAKGPAKPDPFTSGVFVMVHQYRLRGAPPEDAKALLEQVRHATAVLYDVKKLVESTASTEGTFDATAIVVDVGADKPRCALPLALGVPYDASRPKGYFGIVMMKLQSKLWSLDP